MLRILAHALALGFITMLLSCSTTQPTSKQKQKKASEMAAPPPSFKANCSLKGNYLAQKNDDFDHTNHMFLNSDEYLSQPVSLVGVEVETTMDSDSSSGSSERSIRFIPRCHAYSKPGRLCKKDPPQFVDPWLDSSFFLTNYDSNDYDSPIVSSYYNGKPIVDEIFERDGETFRIFALFANVAKDCDSFSKLIVALQPCGDCSDIAMSGRIETLRHFKPDKSTRSVVFKR